MDEAGRKASETKGFEAEREAAWLANDTSKGWKPGTTRAMHSQDFCLRKVLPDPGERQRSSEHLEAICTDCE